MGSYILLCHGERQDDERFTPPNHSEVVYWGEPGCLLPISAAINALHAIRLNPQDIESISRIFIGLASLSGKGLVKTYEGGPNLHLEGDDKVPCMLINLQTHCYARLKSDWHIELRQLMDELEDSMVHLLCCEDIDDGMDWGDLEQIVGLTLSNPHAVLH
ncbi:hypothetical protein HNQ59_003397 [Chitinivorax tropicus]|uniref:Uncharacterized protein n=1 Tax=Chitinivorax tropicus TaxID=714531 RepID=A0A840MLQ1_9PROT|nr:hypothetical protein [Chitinivorax tropicus]MBB5020084.1 hypothetical protein [Chitinivorax tropicus]